MADGLTVTDLLDAADNAIRLAEDARLKRQNPATDHEYIVEQNLHATNCLLLAFLLKEASRSLSERG